MIEQELLRKLEWYTALDAGSAIERRLLDLSWSLEEVDVNLIAHHLFDGGVSACVGLLFHIYVLIVFKNLWRKSFTAGAKTSTVCTY